MVRASLAVAFEVTIISAVLASTSHDVGAECHTPASNACLEAGEGDLYLLQTSLEMSLKETPGRRQLEAMRLPDTPLARLSRATDEFKDFGNAWAMQNEDRIAEAYATILDKTVTENDEFFSRLSGNQEPNSSNTSNASNSTGVTAAEATGVSANEEGDLEIFLVALGTNSAIIIVNIIVFLIARRYCPEVYESNIIQRIAPDVPVEKGITDWWFRSRQVTIDQVQDSVGLDMAGLLEFTHMSMNILGLLSLPLLCVEGPMNLAFGENRAGKDYLSYLSFGNVVDGSWLYWFHCVLVWIVVFTVQVNVYRSMDKFMNNRIRWLRQLPEARANTIMIEDIPLEYRSDSALKAYFEKIFGRGKVYSAHCVKLYPPLTAAVQRQESLELALEQAREARGRNQAQPVDRRQLEQELRQANDEVRDERHNLALLASTVGRVNTATAFVRFVKRCDAELAAKGQYGSDSSEWSISTPPPAAAIQWDALTVGSDKRFTMKIIGYLLVGALYMGYLPAVIWITQIANKIDAGPLQPLWGAFAPTLGLQIMVAFLPTLLLLIFYHFFSLPDTTMAQEMLQNWYFVFQMVFVVLVTAIGGSLKDFMQAIAEKPFDVFLIFGEAMPVATHFYMNFIVLQWVSHFSNLCRSANLVKYIIFGRMYGFEKAKELSEPEDQDYYGIGSRSARFTINFVIGIVYGTLSPPITVLTFINFAICRLVYGYLMVFAENKKPDLGGVFFVHQLKHVFWGNAIYCITMTGVLLGRADSTAPGLIAGASLPYVFWSLQRFNTKFEWERLPVHEALDDGDKPKPRGFELLSVVSTESDKKQEATYQQPELRDSDNDSAFAKIVNYEHFCAPQGQHGGLFAC